MNTRVRSSAGIVALVAFAVVGCSTWEGMGNRERGAVIGAGTGGVAGGVIGNQVGNTAAGAIIGAAIGGAAGAIIGHQMDQQADELDDIAGAEVQRVGEGIVVTFDSGILFDFDSDALKTNARSNLTELAQSLQRHPDVDVLIVGHTDATGTDDYNMNLSYRRANSAAQYLQQQGVAGARIETAGRGETEPIASNETTAGQAENRRVEVAIFASEDLQDEARAAANRN
jgi:outer membrane protein OmpA-like peptidoglycan-associated protein